MTPGGWFCMTAGCMPTIERAMTDEMRMEGELSIRQRMAGLLPGNETPIVPKNSIAGRALVAVVAIMTFLASLTAGAVMLVRAAASDWQSDVSREITIQVRPEPGQNFERQIERAAEIARDFPGIADVRAYSKEESARLLEPWLGSGMALEELPVPRMIVVRLAPNATPNLDGLRKLLRERVAGASLDGHRAWMDRMRSMANTTIAVGIAVLLLMVAATTLSVAFATRGAMAANRTIVEVLHFIGATDGFIAGQFQRHFLVLGLEGGLIGGAAAIILFMLAALFGTWGVGVVGGEQLSMLFGTAILRVEGYVAIVVLAVMIAMVTALTSRHTVNLTLRSVE
jgi:cell division transport system permease protein